MSALKTFTIPVKLPSGQTVAFVVRARDTTEARAQAQKDATQLCRGLDTAGTLTRRALNG
jgi:hypothetical protein